MLQNSDRFQQDIKNYKQAIEQILDDREKMEANVLLNKLIFEVKNLDNMYMDMVYAKQLTSMGKEFKETIQELRKELDTKLKINK